jgi:hypothetical protein
VTKYLKPGWILGTLAVVLAFAGTATASSLITSSKIKDGTIRTRDIKKGAITESRLAKSVQSALDQQSSSVLGSPGAPGATGPAGPKGDTGAQGAKGDRGPEGPALPKDFSIQNNFTASGGIVTMEPVLLTDGGLKFGPYPDGGTASGSLRYDGLDGHPLSDITKLAYTFDYTTADANKIGVPYLRVFLDDGTDVILDPSECAQTTVPEATTTTLDMVQADKLRFDDDACGANYAPLTWDQVTHDHGDQTITSIKVSTGFSGGKNLTAFLHKLQINNRTFTFGD